MKLSALLISNFKGISEEIKILIDNIVVLVGPNNSCKSTILDAYEAYVSMGSALPLDFFHCRDTTKPIVITGIFNEVTQDDIDALGQEWYIENDPEFGSCAKFQIRWETPDDNGVKYSFSNKTNDWKKGGAGGWNTLLQSRLPIPIRLNPNDDYDALEKVVKDLASKNAAKQLKDDKSKVAGIISEIEKLAKEVDKEISGSIGQLSLKIEAELNKLFQGATVTFETGVGKFKAEEAIKDGSKFFIKTSNHPSSLEHQGTGIKRAFLWSAINALCSEGMYKKGTKIVQNEVPKVLLIDEPEINLHPSIIRAARKAIYALADMAGWQVICTTHSPVFIDLTQNHTTLIKVSNTQKGVFYFQTDKAQFNKDERDNLKMLNRCCPTVNEFFFYENSILVEGDTEFLAYQYIIEKSGLEGSYCVINCRGKANIPTFIKIFNQFNANAIAVHDLDTKLRKDGIANAMWTINLNIRTQADSTNGRVKTVVHNPDFEGFYLNESPSKDKPYNLFTHLTSEDFETHEKYKELRESLNNIINGTHSGLYITHAELDAMAE
ncbi:endonuclease [Aeromonas taiwanensis]|uniref:Endonuclease n=1 Tax=Aeromonas taiwanensis TaxID=633417 RepID=A0A5F0KCI3_9GAMM|nr:AAA family ATPase [Aeromonas taiwanensis]TFF77780.1 endonuclease [Aeromonas taiwanensis]TFF78233.1 endonuclease [Aeromonas taiwanensis]TFF82046.1 endonuclease [Aeromonas taiwanensis]